LLFKFFKDILKKIHYYPAKKVKADLKGHLVFTLHATAVPFGLAVLLSYQG